MLQDALLFLNYRVRGNLHYGMSPAMKGQFGALVALLGLEKLLDRLTLLSAPDILLMDEPLASLDLPRQRELMPYLQKLAKQVKIPVHKSG